MLFIYPIITNGIVFNWIKVNSRIDEFADSLMCKIVLLVIHSIHLNNILKQQISIYQEFDLLSAEGK